MYRSLLSLVALTAPLVQAAQPNILFVLTDDQDIELGSLNYLDSVTSRIQQEGKLPPQTKARRTMLLTIIRFHFQQSLCDCGSLLPFPCSYATRPAGT